MGNFYESKNPDLTPLSLTGGPSFQKWLTCIIAYHREDLRKNHVLRIIINTNSII